MTGTIKVTGKTVEEAVEDGLRQLGISRDDADITVLEKPSSGLMGLIRKKQAVVEISVKAGKPEKAPKEVLPAESAEDTSDAAQEKAESSSETGPEEVTPEQPVPEKVEKEKEDLPFSQEEQDAVAAKAKEFLSGVFQSMGLDVTMEKMSNEDRILLNLHGRGLGILIGKHGQTLNALQYLTNLAAARVCRRRYFVLLDVANYRARREKTLADLARRLAMKVKRTKMPVSLEPMEPAERRIVHLALQDDPAVTTDSEGEAPYRRVVIKLKD